jgi:hypothetical protein
MKYIKLKIVDVRNSSGLLGVGRFRMEIELLNRVVRSDSFAEPHPR